MKGQILAGQNFFLEAIGSLHKGMQELKISMGELQVMIQPQEKQEIQKSEISSKFGTQASTSIKKEKDQVMQESKSNSDPVVKKEEKKPQSQSSNSEYRAVSQESKRQGGPQCWTCGGYGHRKFECTEEVNGEAQRGQQWRRASGSGRDNGGRFNTRSEERGYGGKKNSKNYW